MLVNGNMNKPSLWEKVEVMKYLYKYLHVLFFDDIKFYPSLVKSINNEEILNPSEHIFITDKRKVYNEIKSYNNVRFVKRWELFNYMLHSNWIFFHSMPIKKWQVVLLPVPICKRIIWRTWGHDVRPFQEDKKGILGGLKKMVFFAFKKKIQLFFALGISNDIDIVNIEEAYGYKFRYFKLNYLDSANDVKLVRSITPIQSNANKLVLIGHNCSPADNHMLVLDELSKFRGEKIHLVIPLSYSDPKDGYKEKVIEKAVQIFGKDNVTILDDFIKKEDYVRLISKIDIAIMDMYYSNGLGNISYILYFKKKLYICKNGNMDKAFLAEGIIPNYVCDIVDQSFKEFINNDYDDRYMKFCDLLLSEDLFQIRWKTIMDQCDNA